MVFGFGSVNGWMGGRGRFDHSQTHAALSNETLDEKIRKRSQLNGYRGTPGSFRHDDGRPWLAAAS